MKKLCQHEHKAKRSGEWIGCSEPAYSEFGEYRMWLCKHHFTKRQREWIKGHWSGYRAYFFSEVSVVRKHDKKWEVLVGDDVHVFGTRSSAMAYARKKNRQLTNPARQTVPVLRLRTA